MKSTWRKIIIISLVLVIVEVVGIMFFIHPYYKIQRVFNSIDDGNWIETQENYETLSQNQKDKVQTYLNDYGAYICGQYLEGKIDYQMVAAMFDAINSIDQTTTISNVYMTSINHNEYKAVIKRLYAANTLYDSEAIYDAQNDISALNLRMDNETREKIMVELLNEEYMAFLNEEISAETVKGYADIIAGISYYEAYAYVSVVKTNVDYVIQYRNLYTTATNLYSENKYFEVMEICNNVQVDVIDTNYSQLYAQLYTDAYDNGKIYYDQLLDTYVAANDKANTVALMDTIQDYYGTDFDLSGATTAILEDWQQSYIALIENYEAALQADLNLTEDGQYILQNEYTNLKPNSMFLYDVDKNGTAELFMFNDAYAANDYVGCFVYTCIGGNPKYLGFVNVINLCDDSYIIAFPDTFGRTTGDECSLLAFDGSDLTEESSCQYIDGTYYVNGAEDTDINYLSAQSAILAHANTVKVITSGYVGMTEGERYIMEY